MKKDSIGTRENGAEIACCYMMPTVYDDVLLKMLKSTQSQSPRHPH